MSSLAAAQKGKQALPIPCIHIVPVVDTLVLYYLWIGVITLTQLEHTYSQRLSCGREYLEHCLLPDV